MQIAGTPSSRRLDVNSNNLIDSSHNLQVADNNNQSASFVIDVALESRVVSNGEDAVNSAASIANMKVFAAAVFGFVSALW